MSKDKAQTIHCTVDTCQYHGFGNKCTLSSIQVSPLTRQADTAQDSMCESFERKGL